MEMLIVIPIMGNLGPTKPFWGCLLNMVAGPVNLMIIDNQPRADNGEQRGFFEKFILPFWPGDATYHPQDENLGVPRSMQYAYENSGHNVLAFMHNDLYVYERGWDQEVIRFFERKNKVGLVGFFGAEGIDPNSGRLFCYSNMLEAEIHGYRTSAESIEVAVLDGMSMFASRKMLDAGGGVDTSFVVHHFYDLDLSLESIERGFRNFAMPFPIHHQSGQTACQPNFENWANEAIPGGQNAMYELNLAKWKQKWSRKLPWRVGEPWKK